MQHVILVILHKSLKSLQLVLNEFFSKLCNALDTVSASAFTQARSKLAYTAFIELNEKGIVESMYADNDYKSYLGHRLLAIDGSKIIVPDTPELRAEFGTVRVVNQNPQTIGYYCGAMISVCYDVLNRICLDGQIAPLKSYEVTVALKHLPGLQPNDVLLTDRGYASYFWWATLIAKRQLFVCRCPQQSFAAVQAMFTGTIASQIVTLYAPEKNARLIRKAGLPESITLRLVRVVLDNGTIEVLATTLLDEQKYPAASFKPLYHLRWGVETYYDIVKTRLVLENFTGKTVESVKQDFFATLFITGLESILTDEAQAQLDERTVTNRHPQSVNRAVSFNAIKNNLLDLFYKEPDIDVLLDKLTRLFLTKPISAQDHNKSRKRSSDGKLRRYHKYTRKISF